MKDRGGFVIPNVLVKIIVEEEGGKDEHRKWLFRPVEYSIQEH
jgi:hypothetical protein